MNEDKFFYLLIFLILILMLIFILAILLINRINHKNNQELKKQLQDYIDNLYSYNLNLQQNIGNIRNSLSQDMLNFQNQMQSSFQSLNDSTGRGMSDFNKHIEDSLRSNMQSTNELFQKITERLGILDNSQKEIVDLSKNIISLEAILQDKKARGVFGEIELYSLLKNIYGDNRKFWIPQYHLTNGTIVDAVILGNGGINNLAIDAKFPLDNYRRMIDDTLDDLSRKQATKLFAGDIKKHLDDIASKYLGTSENIPLALMFIPSEAVYAKIYADFSEIVDYSYKKHVFMVSPSTLMAYITAVKAIYLNYESNAKADKLYAFLKTLEMEFKRFAERNTKLYNDYCHLNDDFKALNITGDKLNKLFAKINEGNFDEVEENEHS